MPQDQMPPVQTLSVLKKRSQFQAVASVRQRWVTPAFILQVAPVPQAEAEKNPLQKRYGLTASKKMVGIAVLRNRARRRLRALAHEVLIEQAAPAYDYILIARADCLTRPYAQLRQDMVWALKRLKLLQGEKRDAS